MTLTPVDFALLRVAQTGNGLRVTHENLGAVCLLEESGYVAWTQDEVARVTITARGREVLWGAS